MDLTRFGCCCRIGREGSEVGKTAVCSLNTSSVWTDSEFGNSIVLVGTLWRYPALVNMLEGSTLALIVWVVDSKSVID